MMHQVLLTLLDIDVKTMIAVLFWGSLVSVLLVLSYIITVPLGQDKQLAKYCLFAKVFQGAAYFLLFFRGEFSDLVSVNLGNTMLLLGFCWESLVMLMVVEKDSPLLKRLIIGVTCLCIALFNTAEFYYPIPSFRVAVASLCVFLTLFIATGTMLLSSRISAFKRIVSLFYLLFLCLLLPRIFYALQNAIHILSNNLIQTLTFLSLLLISFFCLPAYLLLMKERSDQIMRDMATTDALTGLMNRHSFIPAAEKIFKEHQLFKEPLTLMFFDIDDFKKVNDTYGHALGDTVLQRFADIIRRCSRSADRPCRYGGEEMVLLLPQSNDQAAILVGNRIMEAVRQVRFKEHPKFHFTISGGIASGIPLDGDTFAQWLEKADAALYAAKKAGKDRLVDHASIAS